MNTKTILVYSVLGLSANAAFAPENSGELRSALSKCVKQSPTGACPLFEASDDGTGKPYGPVSAWDISKVTSLSGIFASFSSGSYGDAPMNNFNQDLTKWDTSSVTNMQSMFAVCKDAVSLQYQFACTTRKKSHFFEGQTDVSQWDTSSVTNMRAIFAGRDNFDTDEVTGGLASWDTSSVTMFLNAFAYTKGFAADISKWDTSSATNINRMFRRAEKFNVDISKWDTSKVTTFQKVFQDAESFDIDVSSWDVSSSEKSESFQEVFQGAKSFSFKCKVAEAWKVLHPTSANTFDGCCVDAPVDAPVCPSSAASEAGHSYAHVSWLSGIAMVLLTIVLQ